MSTRIWAARCFKAFQTVQAVASSKYSTLCCGLPNPFLHRIRIGRTKDIYCTTDMTSTHIYNLGSKTFATSFVSWEKHKRKHKKRSNTLKDEKNIAGADPEEDAEDLTLTRDEEKARIIHIVLDRFAASNKSLLAQATLFQQKAKVENIVKSLQAERFSSDDIIKVAGNPDVLETAMTDLISFIQNMRREGFSCLQISDILVQNPEVTAVQHQQLDGVLNALRGIGCSSNTIQRAVVGNPVILMTQPKQVLSRYRKLIRLFIKTEVIDLLSRVPDILICPWEDIENKYNYVTDVMGVEADNIVKSNVLGHSFQHLKTRHIFLQKAGLYERPNKHGSTKIQNPSLKQITDLNDLNFADGISGMSVEEYQTFWKMYELEIQDEEQDDFSDEEMFFKDFT